MERSFEDITFHVGIQKTGSGFLQKKIFPAIIKGSYIPSKTFSYFIEDFSFKDRPILISDENLSARGMLKGSSLNNSIKMWKTLSCIFPKSNIFLFLREPSDFIVSSYKQAVYQGATHDFEEHYSQNWDKLRYTELLDELREMNFSKVLVFDYKQLQSDPAWVVEMIEKLIGGGVKFAYPETNLRRRVHESFDKSGLRFIKFFNKFVYGNSHPRIKNPANPKGSKARRVLFNIGLDPVFLVRKFPFWFLNHIGRDVVPLEKKQKIENIYHESWNYTKKRIYNHQKAFLEGRFEL